MHTRTPRPSLRLLALPIGRDPDSESDIDGASVSQSTATRRQSRCRGTVAACPGPGPGASPAAAAGVTGGNWRRSPGVAHAITEWPALPVAALPPGPAGALAWPQLEGWLGQAV